MTRRLLNSCFKNTVQHILQMSEASISAAPTPAPPEKTKYNGKIKKRNWEERRSDTGETDNKRVKPNEDFVRVKRRKYAMLLGYSGVDYYGMQRNPQMKTIEEDVLKALLKADLITQEAFEQVQQIQFQRAARTDKGVSAARQVVSLKLPEQVDIKLINQELPEQIRVYSVKRVTKGFNSKSNCDARTYLYLLPTLAFAEEGQEVVPETFRITEEMLNNVNEVLKTYLGTKNFHNFTSKKNFKDPSVNRFIISFECEKPFVKDGVEFVVVKIKGQSFMLHQIRKMMGLAIAVIRGLTTVDIINKSYLNDKYDVPTAPGLGLVLDQVHYDRYNKRYEGTHDNLEWSETDQDVLEFKEKYIYPTIIETEIKEKSMILWLETLPKHSYMIREENAANNDKEDEEEGANNSDDEDDEQQKDNK